MMMMTEGCVEPRRWVPDGHHPDECLQGEVDGTSGVYINGLTSPTFSIDLTSFRHDLHGFLLHTAHCTSLTIIVSITIYQCLPISTVVG